MTNDLHRSHPPATSTSIENPAHTRPVSCNFTMHTAHAALAGYSVHERIGEAGAKFVFGPVRALRQRM
ncbi:hypothetical protein BX281_0277 [Streptomyces sp. Ag82_O1-15]|nr:hypothetical protein BX281_0277 [Streptomyces sp. Ag82_O1-15]